jgi:5S rRNA maturation endonuclease (ribonuclease M5)
LSTHLKDRVEKIELLLAKLSEESERGKPLIVEGKKDSEALQALGVNGHILTVKTGGKSYLQATVEIEALGACEVILFLDFDRRGREGTKRLQENLERGKIMVNVKFWRELHSLVGREVSCIESLPAYLSTIQQKTAQKLA